MDSRRRRRSSLYVLAGSQLTVKGCAVPKRWRKPWISPSCPEARIINLSLAGPDDPILAQLVQRAVDSGAVVFGAVGLDEAHRFPATNPNVIAISVGAADDFQASDRRIAVPGGEFLTTVPEGRYDFVTGASYATAHASGLCALMLQQKPDLDSDAIVHWFATLRGPAQP